MFYKLSTNLKKPEEFYHHRISGKYYYLQIKPGSTSTTALSYSSSQLFPNASSSTDVLDLTFGADIPNEVKIIGDPRWNK